VRHGRIRGFVPWLITQRPAVLHKDVLSQADILVSMKLTASQDRDAVGGWIEGQADRADGKRILGALPRLAQGEGYVWAPSDGVLAQVALPRIRSFDSSRAPQRNEPVAMPRAGSDGRIHHCGCAGRDGGVRGRHGRRPRRSRAQPFLTSRTAAKTAGLRTRYSASPGGRVGGGYGAGATRLGGN